MKKTGTQLEHEIAMSLLREARLTGEPVAAVDFLLTRGYSLERAIKAASEYVPQDKFTPFTVSPAQREEIGNLRDRWGDVEQFYDVDEADERREEWDSYGRDWRDAIKRALKAKTRAEAVEALKEAKQIEDYWGDSPQTRVVADILGFDDI